jgi:serine O-acetyltransferase
MFEDLAQDWRRCDTTWSGRLREMIMNPAMWAVVAYRYRRWAATRRWPRALRLPFTIAAAFLQVFAEVTSAIQLSAAARIGGGLYIPHTGYVVVGSGCVIGRNCTLTQGVTLGHAGGGRDKTRSGAPVLGDRVYVGPGSAVIGPLVVGDDSLIGVGSVVTRSVPARAVVAGNPARVRSLGGSFDLITYPSMEKDPDRLSSLAQCGAADASAFNGSRAEHETSPTHP